MDWLILADSNSDERVRAGSGDGASLTAGYFKALSIEVHRGVLRGTPANSLDSRLRKTGGGGAGPTNRSFLIRC